MGDIFMKISLQKRPSVFKKMVDNFKKTQYFKNSKNLNAQHHQIIGDQADIFQERKKSTKHIDVYLGEKILMFLMKRLNIKKLINLYQGKNLKKKKTVKASIFDLLINYFYFKF